jgi:hypothetical protein
MEVVVSVSEVIVVAVVSVSVVPVVVVVVIVVSVATTSQHNASVQKPAGHFVTAASGMCRTSPVHPSEMQKLETEQNTVHKGMQ